MTAMFPTEGVTHEDAKNSLVDPITTNCLELWYSTVRCQPMFDPAAANAMLSELMNLINKGEVSYDCLYLDQVQLAVRYLIQRCLPNYVALGGATANYYEGALDPAATRYNDGMTLCVVPHVENTGACFVNFNGLGWVQLLRTDGVSLKAGDFNATAPALICFHRGYWWLVATGVTQSNITDLIPPEAPNDGQQYGRQSIPPWTTPQWTVVVPNVPDAPVDGQQYGRQNATWTVIEPNPPLQNIPILLTSDLYTYVRPDGNDFTGDGTANDPSKAFRTIDGCWRKIGGLYIASPIYSIVIILGIPGDYEGFSMTGYGGKVTIRGDQNNRTGYRINTSTEGGGNAMSAYVAGMASLTMEGICIVSSRYSDPAVALWGITCGGGSTMTLFNCDFERAIGNSRGAFVWVSSNSTFSWFGVINFRGNGNQIGMCFYVLYGILGPASNVPNQLNFSNFAMADCAWYLSNLSVGNMDACTVSHSGVTGRRYAIGNNSIMNAMGQQLPGNQPGMVSGGGRYNP